MEGECRKASNTSSILTFFLRAWPEKDAKSLFNLRLAKIIASVMAAEKSADNVRRPEPSPTSANAPEECSARCSQIFDTSKYSEARICSDTQSSSSFSASLSSRACPASLSSRACPPHLPFRFSFHPFLLPFDDEPEDLLHHCYYHYYYYFLHRQDR